MQVVQPLSEVSAELLYGAFRQLFVLLDELEQVTTGAVLKNDPQMIPSLVPIVELENVPIFEVVEDSNLVRITQTSQFQPGRVCVHLPRSEPFVS